MKLRRALIALALLASTAGLGLAASQSTAVAGSSAFEQRVVPQSAIAVAASSTAGSASVATTTIEATPAVSANSGRVLVSFKASATPKALSAVARSAETSTGSVDQVVPGLYSFDVPKGRSATKFAKQLAASGRVAYAVPDYVRQPVAYLPPAYPAAGPDDPDFQFAPTGGSYYKNKSGHYVLVASYPRGRSWWLRDIHAPEAWAQGYTGSNIIGKYPLRASGTEITVAVLDSGLYSGHPDNGADIVPGHDFFDHEGPGRTIVEDNDVSPPPANSVSHKLPYSERVLTVAHGTCVSGEIGATANNGVGTIGVGYDTRVVVHKVMGVFANGTSGIPDSALIAAIVYSVDVDHASVINMSVGAYGASPALQAAVNYAYARGAVLVGAKGNDAKSKAFYPGCCKHVISVGALDKNAKAVTIPASYSNYSKTSLDVMAPGTFIWGLNQPGVNLIPSLTSTPGYFVWDGTSMATPVVSGAVAWLWRAAPALSNAEITREVLDSAATGPKSKRYPSGYRRLDMARTYARLISDYPLLTNPVIDVRTVASLGSVPVNWQIPVAHLRGVSYHWVDDSTTSGDTADTGATFPWTAGDHTVTVQASSAYNWDDHTSHASAVMHVVSPVAGHAAWLGAHVAGSAATLATPAYGVAMPIDATLEDASGTPLAGATVALQSSRDGGAFADVPGAIVTNLPGGVYASTVTQEARTFYRFTFAGSGAVSGTVSAAVTIVPGVSLSTPSSKSSISHTKSIAVRGTLMPAHATGSRVVKLKIKRWNGHRWADYSAVWTRVTLRSASYGTYAVSLKLKKGGYRLYAYAPDDGQHSATTSGFHAVAVK
ncbi:MAG: S8 family serine peptidase [Coriobacteriia bacterium]|nr:S8 family serine peptidase [Coriobacteriia bacterium]